MDAAEISTGDQEAGQATDLDPYWLEAGPDFGRRTYRVIVKRRGVYIRDHFVKASEALAAINRVESCYGPPVRLRRDLTENSRHIVLVGRWHGYTFEAMIIEPPPAGRPGGDWSRP